MRAATAVCPVCGTPVEGEACRECGTPVAQAPVRAGVRAPEHQAGRKAVRKPARAAAPTPAPGRRRRTLVVAGALGIFVAGIVLGYAVSVANWVGSPASAPQESPLALASRYLDEGTALLDSDNRAAAAGAFRKAVQQWEAVLRADPGNQYARAYLGLTQFYLGNRTAAFAAINDALARDPDFLWALFNGAWMSEAAGRPEDALRYYQRYVDVAAAEQAKPGKYAEQPELIERQVEAARLAVFRLSAGTVPAPAGPGS